MQHGQYILDRWMVIIIRELCQEMDISFASFSDDWVIEISKEGKTKRIFGYKFGLNDAANTAVAGDKVATYQLLKAHGVPAVEHRLVRTKASYSEGWSSGLDQLVIKPLDGTSGHGIALLPRPNKVDPYIHEHPYIAAWTVSPYEDIQSERRFILLDDKIICQYEKIPVVVDGLTMFNLGLGATAQHSEATEEEVQLAHKTMKVAGLRLAAVDIIRTPNGYKVLEINDGIMMENYMRQSQENKARSIEVYRAIIKKLL